jgi:hypothetical protein
MTAAQFRKHPQSDPLIMTIALPVSLLLALKAFDIPISRPLQIPLITAHFEHQLLRVAQQLIGVFATFPC